VDEALNPAIYNRGVVRVCATDNPGLTTDPARFVKVGICGVERLGCWMDKNSVKNTVDASNTALREDTLSEIEKTQRQNFNEQNIYTPSTDLQKEIKGIDLESSSVTKEKLQGYILKLNTFKPFWNFDIAEVTLMKARVFDKLFRISAVNFVVKNSVTVPSSTSSPSTSSSSSGESKRILSMDFKNAIVNTDIVYLLLNGKYTGIYFSKTEIRFDGESQPIGRTTDPLTFYMDDKSKEIIERVFGKGSHQLLNNRIPLDGGVDDVDNGFDLNEITQSTSSSGSGEQSTTREYKNNELILGFSEEYRTSKKVYLQLNGKNTTIYFLNDLIYFKRDILWDIKIGKVDKNKDNKLVFENEDYRDKIEKELRKRGSYELFENEGGKFITVKMVQKNSYDLNVADDITGSVQLPDKFILSFDKSYSPNESVYLQLNGKNTQIYFWNKDIIIEDYPIDHLIGKVVASEDGSDRITFSSLADTDALRREESQIIDEELRAGSYLLFDYNVITVNSVDKGIDLKVLLDETVQMNS